MLEGAGGGGGPLGGDPVAGEGVLHPGRTGRVRRCDDDSLPLEAPEAIGQDVRRKARELLAQRTALEAGDPVGVVVGEDRPRLAQRRAQRVGEREAAEADVRDAVPGWRG